MSSAIILCGGEYMGIILQSHKQVIIASQRFSLASAIDSDWTYSSTSHLGKHSMDIYTGFRHAWYVQGSETYIFLY